MSAQEPGVDATVTAVCALMLAAERLARAAAEQAGVGSSDATILNHVATAGGSMTPARLSRELSLRPGTLTSILNRLAIQAYVARTPNPRDRRSVLVTLRPAGRRLVAAIDRRIADVLISAPNSAADATRLTGQLNRLAHELDRQADQVFTERDR